MVFKTSSRARVPGTLILFFVETIRIRLQSLCLLHPFGLWCDFLFCSGHGRWWSFWSFHLWYCEALVGFYSFPVWLSNRSSKLVEERFGCDWNVFILSHTFSSLLIALYSLKAGIYYWLSLIKGFIICGYSPLGSPQWVLHTLLTSKWDCYIFMQPSSSCYRLHPRLWLGDLPHYRCSLWSKPLMTMIVSLRTTVSSTNMSCHCQPIIDHNSLTGLFPNIVEMNKGRFWSLQWRILYLGMKYSPSMLPIKWTWFNLILLKMRECLYQQPSLLATFEGHHVSLNSVRVFLKFASTLCSVLKCASTLCSVYDVLGDGCFCFTPWLLALRTCMALGVADVWVEFAPSIRHIGMLGAFWVLP